MRKRKYPSSGNTGKHPLQLGMYANNQRLYIGMITHTEDGAGRRYNVKLPGYSPGPWRASGFPIRCSPVMEKLLLLPLIWKS